MSLFIPITKVDIARQLVYGTLSEEVPDKSGEILDYESAKPAFIEWSNQLRDATGGKSLGNVRAMHGAVAAGKLTDIHFDDDAKRIAGVAKIVDDDEWEKVLEGVYTGFSIGGGYARRWPDSQNPQLMRYTPTLSEVSLVDNPAVPTATFEIIKRDGTRELRKFSFAKTAHTSSTLTRGTPMNNNTAGQDDYESRIETILNDLQWLADEAEHNEDDDMLEHIHALQDCLENGHDEEDGDDEGDENVSPPQTSGARLKRSADDVNPAYRAAYKAHAMKKEIATLAQRIAQLEAQPVAAKGAMRAVSKSDDRKTLQQSLDQLPPADRVRELMKIALSNPVEA